MPCQHLYAFSECKKAYGETLVRQMRGCHHGKTWAEYCRECEVVGLREAYRNGLRKAENARQRLLAMGEMVPHMPVQDAPQSQWRLRFVDDPAVVLWRAMQDAGSTDDKLIIRALHEAGYVIAKADAEMPESP